MKTKRHLGIEECRVEIAFLNVASEFGGLPHKCYIYVVNLDDGLKWIFLCHAPIMPFPLPFTKNI